MQAELCRPKLKKIQHHRLWKVWLPIMISTVYETKISVGAQTSTWDDVTWSYSSSHPGTQTLIQNPEDGEGNRGQMFHICPPALGLNIDTCISNNLLICSDHVRFVWVEQPGEFWSCFRWDFPLCNLIDLSLNYHPYYDIFLIPL